MEIPSGDSHEVRELNQIDDGMMKRKKWRELNPSLEFPEVQLDRIDYDVGSKKT